MMFSGEKGAGLDLGEGDSEGVEITGNNPMHEAVHCASLVKGVMDKYGWTQEHFAKLEAKNKFNGSLNPNAQHQKAYTPEEIAGSRLLSWPITLYMCAPIGDGAAAAIICSKEAAKKLGVKKPHIHIASMAMRSPRVVDPREDEPRPEEIIRGDNVWYTMHEAYEKAGIGPEDVELVELHSPVTPLEMIRWHYLGICPAEDAAKWVEEGNAALNGKVPVNTSGGSTTRGHAIGATGVAQTAEIVWQLRGEAGKRQIEGRSGKGPKVGVVQNSGGFVDTTGQACSIGIVMKR
ncbi:MAG: thiolase family protein [Thermodesulfobacteriota bacterium]|nr:thiolase family protein [Thermodesulfobacteriota bacterium]